MEENHKKPSIWKTVFSKNMLILLFFGFSSGLPLLLMGKTLQTWMADAKVDLKSVGFFALAGLPYTWKFVWSPLVDRFSFPFLGRRRGWLLVTQSALLLSIAGIGCFDPIANIKFIAVFAVLTAFLSASQDIVIDAYRREILSDEALGMGSSIFIYGYRIAMWISNGLALLMATRIGWRETYFIMAGFMVVGIITTFVAHEPTVSVAPPKSLREAVSDPFKEFIRRKGAWLIIAFILLYKMGDSIAGNMLTPFYLQMNYSKDQIAIIAKTLSLPFTLIGGFIGGLLILRIGINKALLAFGILQALSTAIFASLTVANQSLTALGVVILFEDTTSAMGTTAFVAFMGSMTNKKFSATQYAVLSSLMGVPRTVIGSFSGVLAERMGWNMFFVFCGLIAVPGLILVHWMAKLQKNN